MHTFNIVQEQLSFFVKTNTLINRICCFQVFSHSQSLAGICYSVGVELKNGFTQLWAILRKCNNQLEQNGNN